MDLFPISSTRKFDMAAREWFLFLGCGLVKTKQKIDVTIHSAKGFCITEVGVKKVQTTG